MTINLIWERRSQLGGQGLWFLRQNDILVDAVKVPVTIEDHIREETRREPRPSRHVTCTTCGLDAYAFPRQEGRGTAYMHSDARVRRGSTGNFAWHRVTPDREVTL